MKKIIPLCGLVEIELTEEQCRKLRELGLYEGECMQEAGSPYIQPEAEPYLQER